MIINARYTSTCPRCSRPIRTGERVTWERGQSAAHVRCAQSTGTPTSALRGVKEPIAIAAGGVRHEKGSNRRPGSCERCGAYLQVGAGRLEYCVEDSGCPKHHDESGYHLYCADAEVCAAQREELLAQRDVERIAAVARKAAAEELSVGERLGRDSGPGGKLIASDPGRPGSYASYPYLVVSSDGAVYHVNPIYDDSPAVTRTALTLDAAIDTARRAGWTLEG